MILSAMCSALVAVIASTSGLNVAIQALAADLDASQGELLWVITNQDDGQANRLRLNDVMGLEVGDGTPEIMKAIIARGEVRARVQLLQIQIRRYEPRTVRLSRREAVFPVAGHRL